MKLIICLMIFYVGPALAAPQHTDINQVDGLGINGYDPVTYFTLGKAVEGKKSLSEVHAGVTYYFSSQESRELFKKDPAKYLPMYGGWCAYAMANGEKVKIDPETFKIIEGKLYLFYNFYFNNTLTKWNKDEINLKNQADQHWSRINR